MASHSAPVDDSTFRELELLVRHLGEELATFRRRALQAESRVRSFEAALGNQDLFSGERLAELEAENADLRARLTAATERTQELLGRVRFLRQQQDQGESR